ncbi:MAG: hypothetical protein JSS55_05105 [Proteobacteria bacterium]|jgi:hypothetical protein|nr:hypothetical protein [Pseudomonadota bacterium]
MQIIVSRSRIAGTLPHYIYRALVPAEGVAAERRALAGTVAGPKSAGRFACIRIAPLLAPARYFVMNHVERTMLASRIGAVGRRIEWLIIRTIFPEMTAASVPIVFQLDHDPGDACVWTDIEDLVDTFDRFEPDLAILTAFDLGLRQGDGRQVA